MRTTSHTKPNRQWSITLSEWLRAGLSAPARRRIRALSDPVAGPLGSIRGVRTREPVVTLTFDDGPDPAHTPGVLDVLARYGAKATWFLLVDRAESHPEIVQRILAEGHDVGLHGADHRRLTRLPPSQVLAHIREGAARLGNITGQSPRFFRPPYGSQNVRTFLAARRAGMEVVVWSADCDDWSKHPEAVIAKRASDAASPGGVLLLHDTLANDPLVSIVDPNLDRRMLVDLVIQGLGSRGYRSISLSELLRCGKPHRTLWFRP
jgi:peptidoglycan/xylan/chitin deacetylase (PgdA/CDA1 family)